jgi:hypothetical protein
MTAFPTCSSLGLQCRELEVTLRIAELDEDDAVFHDAIATWLLGHNERISFGRPYVRDRRLLVDAIIHVGCKYLKVEYRQAARCTAHGFSGPLPAASTLRRPVLQHGPGEFTLVQDREVQLVKLRSRPSPQRSLPTLPLENPCAGAPCRTADHRRGAACCRDLTVELVIEEDAGETQALLRSRQSPYLCKVQLGSEDILECEIISACGYLATDDLSCTLHGSTRPDGAAAKPSVCSDWPDQDADTAYHPGCRLVPLAR